MFYPVDSLRRGGRFYLLWMADSWPHRFASITNRQVWSQDVRQLCDELKEVIISESGRPMHRYSLRLSSQLMRGLVRLYQKKVTMFLNDMCMISATVIKNSNKRYNIVEVTEAGARQAVDHRRRLILEEVPENEQRVEEKLQNSTNVVANVQDITLKEAAINEPILPNVGFGEENEEQELEWCRSMELMREGVGAGAGAGEGAHSALGAGALDCTDRHERTRRATHDVHMENISALDATACRLTDGSVLSITDLGTEIPDIPEVPIPPIPEIRQPQEAAVEMTEAPIVQPREDVPREERYIERRESTLIELEELEDVEPRPKRQRKLIIDKKIQISSDVFRVRIQNPRVELRCEHFSDVIVKIQVPFELYMNRPCHSGHRERSNIAPALTRLYMRNLGVIHRDSAHREMEAEEMQRAHRYSTRPRHFPEVAEPVLPEPRVQPLLLALPEGTLAPPEVDMSRGAPDVSRPDIADMETQQLEILSQQKENGKRGSDDGDSSSQKRQKSVGTESSREHLQKSMELVVEAELPEPDTEVDKENIAANRQVGVVPPRGVKNVTVMLQRAGLSDLPSAPPEPPQPLAEPPQPPATHSRRQGSETSESLLGSLDRTKVSLGDSDSTTDSRKFLRDQWGTEGTMYKIIKCINARRRGETVTVKTLIARGPVVADYKNIITAKCFTSILKLKQHGFITIRKCPTTLEILDIMLGPNFENGTCY